MSQVAEFAERFKPPIVDFKIAIIGGGLALLFAAAGMVATGKVSGAEGRVLLESMLPTTRFLCSAVITGSATILALMLTVLGLSKSTDRDLRPLHYRRIYQISLLDSIVIIAAMLLLMYHSIPIQEADGVPAAWFSTIYYVLLGLTAALGGAFVAVVLMLFKTLSGIIHLIRPMGSSPLSASEEELESTS